MNPFSLFSAAGRFLGKVGNQAAVSVAASAVAAACLAVPGLIGSGRQEPSPPSWQASLAPDGKIRDRHRDAEDGEANARLVAGRGLVLPAALAMPLTLDWPQSPATAGEAGAKPVIAVLRDDAPAPVKAPLQPPRRPLSLGRNLVATVPLAAPVPVSPPIQLAALSAPLDAGAEPSAPRPPAELLGRSVPKPVGYVGQVVSGAAGLVGAAGSWTSATASALIPRF